MAYEQLPEVGSFLIHSKSLHPFATACLSNDNLSRFALAVLCVSRKFGEGNRELMPSAALITFL